MPATSGLSWLIKQDTTGGSPVSIGGQRNGTLTINGGTIDITSKDGASWVETINGTKSWSLSGDGIVLEGNASYESLLDDVIAGNQVDVQVVTPGNTGGSTSPRTFSGTGTISSLEESAPYDGVYSYSVTIEGDGALTESV